MSDKITVKPGTLVTFEGIDLHINANLNEPEFGRQRASRYDDLSELGAKVGAYLEAHA